MGTIVPRLHTNLTWQCFFQAILIATAILLCSVLAGVGLSQSFENRIAERALTQSQDNRTGLAEHIASGGHPEMDVRMVGIEKRMADAETWQNIRDGIALSLGVLLTLLQVFQLFGVKFSMTREITHG